LPVDGVVKALSVKVGDKVSEGSLILDRRCGSAPVGAAPARESEGERPLDRAGAPAADYGAAGVYEAIDVRVPDIGDFKDVPVIEGPREVRRHGEGRRRARHARVGQGDDGRALAARRHRR
jgi:pyruvate/2-oxoglutarate dehydrogenase complex dihydrolipoamide acyltransferase (E2) component